MPHGPSSQPPSIPIPVDDNTPAVEVLREEHRLALDGYHLDVMPAEADATLAKITLMVGSKSFERTVFKLDTDCPTRDEAVLAAMVGYMNCGGDPEHLLELAQSVSILPRIKPESYTLIGAYGRTDWVAYYQHRDGRLFEVHHGLMSEEITRQQLDDLVEEDLIDPVSRVRLAGGPAP